MRIESIVLGIGLMSMLVGAVGAQKQTDKKSQAAQIFARAKPDDFLGDEGCVDCHTAKAKAFNTSAHAAVMQNPKLPLDKRGCEGCHGAGGIHRADDNPQVISFRKMSPQESSAACLRCHEQTLSASHWKRSSHSRANLSCVSCHQIHPDSDPDWEKGALRKGNASDPRKAVFVAKVEEKSLLKADEATLCGQCHAPQVAEFRLTSHHPVPEGSMLCSDCHSAHPTKESKSKTTGLKGDCVTCHAQYAGPFVYQHEPVAGGSGDGCLECHKSHGSHNPKMLKSFSRGLCAQCHTEKIATHYPGQSCWNAGCHVAPHGSNTDPRFLHP